MKATKFLSSHDYKMTILKCMTASLSISSEFIKPFFTKKNFM